MSECEGSGTCPYAPVWVRRSTNSYLCDDHAADIDLDDLEDLRGPYL